MSGYARQDTLNKIDDGELVEAAPLDSEFDALAAAFLNTTGHKHSGVAGEGAPITVVGPAQDIVVTTNAVTPKTDNTVDLGSSTLEFKDLWVDGVANIDSLVADAGTIGGVDIVGTSTTQTLTNKTINLASNTLVATSAQLAAAVTDETGTGVVVFSDSPVLTGTPTAPTAAQGVNTTQLATTAYVVGERTATATLANKTIDLASNTLTATSAQIAAAVSDETGSGNLVFSASPSLTGVPTAPTAPVDTNTTQIATTAHVFAERDAATTLTNKTLTSPTINTPTVSGGTMSGTAVSGGTITGTAVSGGTITGSAISGGTASGVAITGGSISGITDLAIADGGTGASDAASARVNLALGAAIKQFSEYSSDLNAVPESGFYVTDAATTNAPGAFHYFVLVNLTGVAAGFMIAGRQSLDEFWYRRKHTSVWQPWVRIRDGSDAFTSSAQTLTANTTTTVAHGLGVRPTRVSMKLVCGTADAGYSVGDEIFLQSFASGSDGISVWTPNATQISFRVGPQISMPNPSGTVSVLTLSRWTLILLANR